MYSAVPPLFRVTTKKNEYVYLKDQEALDVYTKKYGKQTINRMKGLGEQDPKELSYCLLDNNSRNVVQLIVTDEDKTKQMFNDLYGKKVEPRRQFLNEYSSKMTIDME